MSKTCKHPGCAKPIKNGRGWCAAHYRRWLRYGTPEGAGSALRGEPLAFFKETVLHHQGDVCLIWPYSRFNSGYAKMHENRKNKLVHRRVCEEIHGSPPSEFHHAAHSCGNGMRGCVSPRHLSWKTVQMNHADKRLHGTMPTKLSEDQARTIVALRGTVKQKDLALKFGVSPSTVGAIQTGRKWAWLHD